MSHAVACLIVAYSVLAGRIRAIHHGTSRICVNLQDFGYSFKFCDGPNLKTFRAIHNDIWPQVRNTVNVEEEEMDARSDDDENDDDQKPRGSHQAVVTDVL